MALLKSPSASLNLPIPLNYAPRLARSGFRLSPKLLRKLAVLSCSALAIVIVYYRPLWIRVRTADRAIYFDAIKTTEFGVGGWRIGQTTRRERSRWCDVVDPLEYPVVKTAIYKNVSIHDEKLYWLGFSKQMIPTWVQCASGCWRLAVPEHALRFVEDQGKFLNKEKRTALTAAIIRENWQFDGTYDRSKGVLADANAYRLLHEFELTVATDAKK
jgi:hypothetical protein